MTNILLACLVASGSVGMCRAELNDYIPDEPPSWATEEWVEYAAHIVASEAGGVPVADKVIACTMIRDIERGWNPWNLRKRWFGWGTPDRLDREAVRQALINCDDIPSYKFVGNVNDTRVWLRNNMITNGPHDIYLGNNAAVVGIRW